MVSYKIYAHNGIRYIRIHDVPRASMVPRIGETIRIDLIKGGPNHEDYKVKDVIHRMFHGEEDIYVLVEKIQTVNEQELY